MEMKGTRASRNRAISTDVFAICISDNTPSCMRAPPEAETMIKGTRFSTERRVRRAIFSPTTEPIDPPMKLKSDRKSTRLNSSHGYISYAVFCLKKKKKQGKAHLAKQHNPSPPKLEHRAAPYHEPRPRFTQVLAHIWILYRHTGVAHRQLSIRRA